MDQKTKLNVSKIRYKTSSRSQEITVQEAVNSTILPMWRTRAEDFVLSFTLLSKPSLWLGKTSSMRPRGQECSHPTWPWHRQQQIYVKCGSISSFVGVRKGILASTVTKIYQPGTRHVITSVVNSSPLWERYLEEGQVPSRGVEDGSESRP